MRQEIREYKFDWMLWTSFAAASRLKSGTEKEYRHMLKYIPYFRGTVDAVLGTGGTGTEVHANAGEISGKLHHGAGEGKQDGHYHLLLFSGHFLRHGHLSDLP